MAGDLPDAPWAEALPDAPWTKPAAPEPPPRPTGYLDRVAADWKSDTADIFHEGVEATMQAPGQLFGLTPPTGYEDLGKDMAKKLVSIGASDEEAKRESDYMLRRLQRNQGLLGLIGGPLQAITSPLFGAYRAAVSRPIEEATGFPKETTEGFTMAAVAAAGMAPHTVGRVRISRNGEVSAQAIGELPKEADFKTSAEILGGEHTEANLRRAWDENGIHPAEAVNDAAQDAFVKHQLTAPIEAYHGSPHDFEAFSVGQIGTGEGAQAYGHGLYFAENPAVARSYQLLSDATINGRSFDINNPLHKAVGLVDEFGSREAAITEAKARIKHDPGDFYGDVLRHLESDKPLPAMQTNGSMYGVRIHADQDKMLNWDKPLSEQPDILKAIPKELRQRLEDHLEESGHTSDLSVYTGGEIYKALGRLIDDQSATQVFHDAGIPGIKYLDQGSRDEGTGTRNFVIFDDKDVEITHKNGQPFYDSNFSRAQNQKFNAIMNGQEEGEIPLRAVGAEVASEPPANVPLSTQPAAPPGRLMTAAHDAADKLFDIGRDMQMLVAPMARGTTESMAIAKDFANTLRRNRWDWSRIDDDIEKRFTPEQRKRMWDAADEESVLRQEGQTNEHMGLATLEPAERAAVEELQTRAQTAWLRARDIGMVEGEGLPAYTPRMVLNVGTIGDGTRVPSAGLSLNAMGQNLRTRTAQMLHRKYLTAEETEAAAKAKYGGDAEIARDIRALPLATAKLEDAIAGRTLINSIKDYGKRTGDDTVVEGAIPAKTDQNWFTMQEHPAFMQWRPKLGELADGTFGALKDEAGNAIFEQVPIYVRGDFEGPLRAVLTQKSGPLYGAAMSLKAKTMSLIMNSPLIHNAVEWGRAMPSMPGKVATFKIYFEGNRARKDVPTMHEAIDAGMVPIGHRFFNQDITSIMEAPDLAPGRSWTAKVLGFVPGLFDEGAGTAVKSAIDKAGNFWHNTLLWDRVADLQAGLYTNFRDEMLAKGVDRQTAARAAAHWANRYAGALPQEAMSDAARKISNMLLFSRSFTMGNLGALKDVFTGLPKDVLAQIERDAGFREGAIAGAETPAGGPVAVSYAKSMARRKAMAIVTLDIGMMYVGNSLLQNAANVLLNDSTLDKEMHGYAERFLAKMQSVKEHPLELIQPFNLLQSLSATATNEPGKQDRIHIGNAADGTAIYARNPVGKIADEFIGYMTGPLDMLRRKLGTIARPAWQVMSNDAGFGRKVYDPDADTPAKYLANLGLIAKHFAAAQVPTGQAGAFSDLVKGEGDPKVNALQAFGPLLGVTFSKGAPGGQAVGEMYHAKTQHEFAVQAELPDIRRQIQRGDVGGAQERMTELGIPAGLQRFYVKTTTNPATRLGGRTLKDFYLYSTPEQKQRLENAR